MADSETWARHREIIATALFDIAKERDAAQAQHRDGPAEPDATIVQAKNYDTIIDRIALELLTVTRQRDALAAELYRVLADPRAGISRRFGRPM